MEPIIINRSLVDKKKSADNRQRFLNRYREVIRLSTISNSNKLADKNSIQLTIPLSLSEPVFHYDTSESYADFVIPGNKFVTQDELFYLYAKSGQGGAGDGSGNGDSESDSFSFTITDDEFANIVFDGCSLPNFIKKRTKDSTEFTNERAGYGKHGVPSRLSLVRSFNAASMRKIATKAVIDEEIKELEKSIPLLPDSTIIDPNILEEIDRLQEKKKNLLFLDDYDLRYAITDKKPKPISSAVIFFLLDVSGSMAEEMKANAKKFFYLIKLFIETKYKNTEVVFIRHTDTAKEVTEEEFFTARETGGTYIYSALELTNKIIDTRYNPDDYNIYVINASDGDTFGEDIKKSKDILTNVLKNKIQLCIYSEVLHPKYTSVMSRTSDYKQLMNGLGPKFKSVYIIQDEDVLDAFYAIFKRSIRTIP